MCSLMGCVYVCSHVGAIYTVTQGTPAPGWVHIDTFTPSSSIWTGFEPEAQHHQSRHCNTLPQTVREWIIHVHPFHAVFRMNNTCSSFPCSLSHLFSAKCRIAAVPKGVLTFYFSLSIGPSFCCIKMMTVLHCEHDLYGGCWVIAVSMLSRANQWDAADLSVFS